MTRSGVDGARSPVAPSEIHLQSWTVTRTAAFFDLDKTVIAKSSTLAFGRPFFHGGLINRRAVLKAAYAQFVFSLQAPTPSRWSGSAPSSPRCAPAGTSRRSRDRRGDAARHRRPAGLRRGSRPDRGAPAGRPRDRDRLEQRRRRRRADRRAARRRPGRGDPHGGRRRPLHRRDRVLRLRREQGGRVRELAAAGGYDLADCYAYSDSITDLPMLEAVGHPTAVNPDRALRKAAPSAAGRCASSPARCRCAPASAPPAPVVTGAAVGVGAAVVGLAWYARHRACGTLSARERADRPARRVAGGAAAPDAPPVGVPQRRAAPAAPRPAPARRRRGCAPSTGRERPRRRGERGLLVGGQLEVGGGDVELQLLDAGRARG